MREGDTRDFDQSLLLAFRSKNGLFDPLGPSWLAEVMRDITALGSFTVLGLVTFSVAGFLMLTRKRHAAGIVVLSITSGTLVSSLLKWLFARPVLTSYRTRRWSTRKAFPAVTRCSRPWCT